MNNPTDTGPNIEFIRLLFTDPVEEAVAYRWATRLGRVLEGQVMELRPETTFAQILRWGADAEIDSMDFTLVFEPELRMELSEFLDYAEHVTFREMVGRYAERFGS